MILEFDGLSDKKSAKPPADQETGIVAKKKRRNKRKNVSAEKHESIYEDRTVYERGPRHDDFWQDYDPYHERPGPKKPARTASSRFAKEYDSDFDERRRRPYPPMRPGYYGPPMRYGPPPHMRGGYPPARGAPRGDGRSYPARGAPGPRDRDYPPQDGHVRPGQYAGTRPYRLDRDHYESLETPKPPVRGGRDRNSRNKPQTAVRD